MSKSNDLIKPLRISTELDTEVKRVSKEIGLSESDVMRKSIEHGLSVLENLLRSPIRKRLEAPAQRPKRRAAQRNCASAEAMAA